jgi:nucleotide-binding universal stress UspA family protein
VFQRLLVPLDFTKKNAAALEMACRLSDPKSGELVLLHVIEEIERISSRELKAFYKRLEANAIKEMSAIERKVRGKVRLVRQEILIGRRAEAVLRYASEHDVDLIVMSSHRVSSKAAKTGWATLSHVIAALAPCNTLLVK